MQDNKVNKKKSTIQVLIIVAIIVLIIVVVADLIVNYVPLSDIFKTQTINNVTSKEVTVTDEGIADAVDKLYDATVIVKVGTSSSITGWGSGFVYKTDDDYGYILTNHHVVSSATLIQIEYSDGTTTTGTLVGSDEYSDVAVIKVDVDTVLAVAEIGDSESVRVGDTVFAIGTPVSLEYSFTVTRGILSGKNRLVQMTSQSTNTNSIFGTTTTDSWYMSLLQIDASINSGNSGGPLANCNGEVIGITNSKLSSSFSSTSIENMGFAIPIEDALSVAQLIESGTNTNEKPILGISMSTVENAANNGIKLSDDIDSGVVVVAVVDDSNASRAGLKKGDVITKFNGEEVEDYRHLKYYLYKCNIGDKVSITYIRNGNEKTVEVTLKD